MSFCSRHFLQSTYFWALGNFRAPKFRWSSLMSHRATTFSVDIPPKWASPRPQVPMRAMLSLLLGASAPEEPNFREDKAGRTAEGHAFEKLASFHCAIIDHLSPGVKQTYRHYQAHRDATTGTPDSSGSPAAVRGLPDESGVPVSLAAQTSRLIDASSDFPSAEQERALCTRRSVTSFQPCIPKHNVLLWDSRLGPPLQERSPRQPYGRHARHSTDTRRG